MSLTDEIKEALEKATSDWHYNGNEIVSKQNIRHGIGGFLTEEDNELAVNAPKWLKQQNELIESLQQENQRYKKALEKFANRNNWTWGTFKGDIIAEWSTLRNGFPDDFARQIIKKEGENNVSI